jgi:alkylated DNA repair dioxygenase AlkB
MKRRSVEPSHHIMQTLLRFGGGAAAAGAAHHADADAAPAIVLFEDKHGSDARLRLIAMPRTSVTGARLRELRGWVCRPPALGGHQHRDVLFTSDATTEYPYSGTVMRAVPLVDVTREALALMNSAVERFVSACFNGLLLNRYRDGADHIGWHADDERTLGGDGCVATWSFGAEREFAVRDTRSHDVVWRGVLPANSIALMEGASFQRRFQHCIPARMRVGGERISVTGRTHVARAHTPTTA